MLGDGNDAQLRRQRSSRLNGSGDDVEQDSDNDECDPVFAQPSEEAVALVQEIVEKQTLSTEMLTKLTRVPDFRCFMNHVVRDGGVELTVQDPAVMVEFLVSSLSTCRNLLILDLLYEFVGYCLLERLFPEELIGPIMTFAMSDLTNDYNSNLFVNGCEMYPSKQWIEPAFRLRPASFCNACIGFLNRKLVTPDLLPHMIAKLIENKDSGMFTVFHEMLRSCDGITREFLDQTGVTKVLIETIQTEDRIALRKAYIFMGCCISSGLEIPIEALTIALDRLENGISIEKEEIIKMFANIIHRCSKEAIAGFFKMGLLDCVIDMIGYETGYAEKCCLELFLASFDIAPDLVASKLSSDVVDSLDAITTSPSADATLIALAHQLIQLISTHNFTQRDPPA